MGAKGGVKDAIARFEAEPCARTSCDFEHATRPRFNNHTGVSGTEIRKGNTTKQGKRLVASIQRHAPGAIPSMA